MSHNYRSLVLLEDILDVLDQGVAIFSSELRFALCNENFLRLAASENDLSVAAGERAEVVLKRLFGPQKSVELQSILKQRFGTLRLCCGGDRFLRAEVKETANKKLLLTLVDEGAALTAVSEAGESLVEDANDADQLLRTIVDACPANFMVSRIEDGKIIYYSAASKERFGNIESSLSFFLRPEDRETYLQALLPTGTLNEYRVQFRRSDGSILDGMTSARVTDYKGERVIVSSTRDISEQLKMQAELERQREIAHRSEKLSALGELLAGVAHELNNPLSVILGYAQMMEGEVEDPVLSRRVERIAQSADRSARIVRTFLAMARQSPARKEPVSINECLTIALEVREYALKANGTQINCDFDSSLPEISGDSDQLVQVFTNFITNAEHVLDPKGGSGKLSLRSFLASDGKEVVVEVEDNGPGILPEVRERIFEPFYTTKGVGEGTGLGLSFCHRIVEAHGGSVEANSEPGNGTRFVIRIPVGQTKAHQPVPGRPEAKLRSQAHIMVVDDDSEVAELTRDMLLGIGMQPAICHDGRKALARLSKTGFDAIICDFNMPGMNGGEFYKQLVSEYPDYLDKIAFITGDVLGDAPSRFFDEHKVPFIEKPISKDGLKNLLCRILEGEPVK